MKYKHYDRSSGNEDLQNGFEKRHKRVNTESIKDERHDRRRKQQTTEKGFTCLQCGIQVTTGREMSGVNNRNHCPHCLWSRHVDEYKAGDRKAECRSRMQPIGLTIKQTLKRYGTNSEGELMLIHRCTGCGKLSINRIASDDDAMRLYALFRHNEEFPGEHAGLLESSNIRLLGTADLTTVYSQLFGWQAIIEEFEPQGSQRENADPIDCELETKDMDL